MQRGCGAIDLHTVLDEMWESAKKEFDFLQEGMNLKRFYELNKDVAYATCPRGNLNLTTIRMLVMEHIGGIPINDLKTLRQKGYDMDDLGNKLAENYVKQVLGDAFFHADPHSGNIMVREKQIVWIDLGMMGTLSERDRALFSSAAEAIAFGDGRNDLEMLGAVGTGIAMGNAGEDVKSVADDTCKNVEDDGIYYYCVEKGLIQPI